MEGHHIAPGNPGYETKDLNAGSWEDFEEFFANNNGVQGACWCVYYHRTGKSPGATMQERYELNRDFKKQLVLRGQSRAVLVYYRGKVVASCQYGTREELPRTGNGRFYRKLPPPDNGTALWRITCFFVDRQYRRQGVARLALGEVIKRIQKEDGGLVEAYPVTNQRAVPTWFGSVSMFTDLGFQVVAELGRSNVLVRKLIENPAGQFDPRKP